MAEILSELEGLRSAYKAQVETWIGAIREEEALASADPDMAKVDLWEGAHFREEEQRDKVKAAKKLYENALREAHFGF